MLKTTYPEEVFRINESDDKPRLFSIPSKLNIQIFAIALPKGSPVSSPNRIVLLFNYYDSKTLQVYFTTADATIRVTQGTS